MIKSHKGFKVRQHKPWTIWLLVLLVLLLLAAAFYVGTKYQVQQLSIISLERDALQAYIAELEIRNRSLVQKNASLSSNSKIENDAYLRANTDLVKLQRQMLTVKEELAFYQGIVSPSKAKLGVNLQSFELTKKNNNGRYSYKLVLTKRGKSNKTIKGRVAVSILGDQEGKSKKLSLTKIKEDFKKTDFNFSFKYFQILTGEFILPEGYTPYDVAFSVKSTSKKIKSFTETKTWASVLPTGA